jgi:hypothetical protein
VPERMQQTPFPPQLFLLRAGEHGEHERFSSQIS